MYHDDFDATPEIVHEAEAEAMGGQSLEQIDAARDWLSQDPLRWVRLPWDAVTSTCGPLHPGSYWLVGAYTGGGKSTFLANVLMDFAARGTRTYYLPLEQEPRIVRTMWAGLACGYDPNLVAQLQWGKLPAQAANEVRRYLDWQEENRHTVYFDEVTTPGLKEIWEAFRRAGRQGYQVVILDHFGRLLQKFHSDTVALAQAIKEGAKQHGMAAIVAGQLNRGDGRNPLRMYLPPTIEDVKMGNVLVEEADVALGLYRPLQEGVSKADMLLLKAGQRDVTQFAEHGVVGVKVMKHRFGSNTGKTFRLNFKAGRITDPETETRTREEARYGL